MDTVNLFPERGHIHDQVLDHRQVAERLDSNVPMPLHFIAEGSPASQFLAPVDCHRTRPANRGAAGVAEGQAPVAFVLDPNEGIQDGHPAPDIESELFRVAGSIDFRIEPLDGEGQAHG
jgi:hypothetical protein